MGERTMSTSGEAFENWLADRVDRYGELTADEERFANDAWTAAIEWMEGGQR